jgi:hypothetical protein
MNQTLCPTPAAAAYIARNHKVREAARLMIAECCEEPCGYEQVMFLALRHLVPGVFLDEKEFLASDDFVFGFFDALCDAVANEVGIRPEFGINLRRREGRRWMAELKMSVPGFDRAIGAFECERKMAALHLAGMAMLGSFADLIEKALNRKLVDEKLMQAEARSADVFSERLRLQEEAVRAEALRKERRQREDEEWDQAAPRPSSSGQGQASPRPSISERARARVMAPA